MAISAAPIDPTMAPNPSASAWKIQRMADTIPTTVLNNPLKEGILQKVTSVPRPISDLVMEHWIVRGKARGNALAGLQLCPIASPVACGIGRELATYPSQLRKLSKQARSNPARIK